MTRQPQRPTSSAEVPSAAPAPTSRPDAEAPPAAPPSAPATTAGPTAAGAAPARLPIRAPFDEPAPYLRSAPRKPAAAPGDPRAFAVPFLAVAAAGLVMGGLALLIRFGPRWTPPAMSLVGRANAADDGRTSFEAVALIPDVTATPTRPQPTPPPTRPPTKTATLTAAPTYTAYPTYTPLPTYTLPPTLRAPARATLSAVAPPGPAEPAAGAVTLTSPGSGATVQGCVTFTWQSTDAPRVGERYALLVCSGSACRPRFAISGDPPAVTWNPGDTRGNPDLSGAPGPLRWAVAIEGPAGIRAMSDVRELAWAGGGCGDAGGGGDDPGGGGAKKPEPTPRIGR
jgi:hypothetical protein